jgi:Skp family chaperone for outer membrane proteins
MTVRLSVVLFLLTAPFLTAQALLTGKIGIVDLAQAIRQTEDGKATRDSILNAFAGRIARLKLEDAELEGQREKLKRISRSKWLLWRFKESNKLARVIQERSNALQQDREKTRDAIDRRQQWQINALGVRMALFLDAYAKEYGYSLILQGDVITILPTVVVENITADVVRRYDEAANRRSYPSPTDNLNLP